MTNDKNAPMTCDEFSSAIGDLLDGTMTTAQRERLDAHRLDCASCDALAADFIRIKGEAAKLPVLAPSHDLWNGIESRIGAEVLELPVGHGADGADFTVAEAPAATPTAAPVAPAVLVAQASPLATAPWRRNRPNAWRALAAASVLVTLTAGITWSVASSTRARVAAVTGVSADTGFAAAMAGTRNTRLASNKTLAETYDREIGALRKIVDDRRADIDSATLVIVERNLKVIDQAIAESKAALAQSPSSAFLLDQLTNAYDSKLRTLRALAAIPTHG